MKNFKITTFVIWTAIFSLITFVSFMTAFANDEGTLPANIFVTVLANSFYVFRFPTHSLFSCFMSNGWSLFLAGLGLNSIFYGFVMERLICFYGTTRAKSKTSS